MKNSFIDKDSTFREIKDKSDIVSALKEVAKSKNLSIDFRDDLTMESIAKNLDVDVGDILLIINEKNSTAEAFKEAYPQMDIKSQKNDKPKWMDEHEIVELDVRESLSKGVDPFGMIMKSVATLNGKVLHIINSFETVPLYSVLGKQGFEYYSEESEGIWHIYFYKK